jgi:hypothetical protein
MARLGIGALLALGALSTSCNLSSTSQASDSAVQALKTGQDVTTQSVLRDTLVAARTLLAQRGTYGLVNAAMLGRVEPALCYVHPDTAAVPSGASCIRGSGDASISVYGQDSTFAAAAMSKSGTCFWIRDQVGAATTYGSGEPCTGNAAVAANAQSFPGSPSSP